ncbi:MAG: hypothetical protein O3A51_08380, partial [Verrucomicrobia bacterium]|nr:hypothetical protein [Verrucomicrobiota bacterium]
ILADLSPASYKPHWSRRVPAGRPNSVSNGLMAVTSPGLPSDHVKQALDTALLHTLGRQPWQMACRIAFDAEGAIEHIFIETPSGDSAIDRYVESHLYKSAIRHTEAVREASVSLTYRP